MVEPSDSLFPAAIGTSQSLSVHNLLRPVVLEPTPPMIGAWSSLAEGEGALVALTPTPVIAKQFNQDILGDISHAWKHFIDSGQVWALVIGIVMGYMIRNLTAY